MLYIVSVIYAQFMNDIYVYFCQFGLRQFYREHDEIMLEIRHQHSLCIQELAQIETEAEIDSARKYFKHVVLNT